MSHRYTPRTSASDSDGSFRARSQSNNHLANMGSNLVLYKMEISRVKLGEKQQIYYIYIFFYLFAIVMIADNVTELIKAS